ncbi:MAG: aminopeptidase [Pseudomonadota bacterium]|jgi:aminopeptidase N
MTNPITHYRKDYQQPDFWIDQVDLTFELDEDNTLVHSTLSINRRVDAPKNAPLILNGEAIQLQNISLNYKTLSEDSYQIDVDTLKIPNVPDNFILQTTVRLQPKLNTALSGLYTSSNNFCTQCEAEGFRRITYYLDRPDVMARFSTTIIADKQRYPVLLSNGNRIETQELENGKHLVKWEDPFLKPSYLFALVAGNLACHAGEFITKSGRNIRLEIWVEPHNIDKCEHALVSLQKAMKWDEENYNLEYDLDLYMIVAVSDFNAGAMENKGLNVFNAKYVLASPQTATDEDYENIEAVIAHEYFHNWTGNRVTCRDWFQLTLKEGLTVFRDQQFTADMTSQSVKRILDVNGLRTAQFAEDASAMAHPIRPESYIQMNNFYTTTVYNKGAEIIGLYHTLLGKEGFLKGMNLYFKRHDGQAVTCDDFRRAMADANGKDLTQFERWYDQAGTPLITVETAYDQTKQTFELNISQKENKQGLVEQWKPWHIPIKVGLIDSNGQDMNCRLENEIEKQANHILELKEEQRTFRFVDIKEMPIPSVLRHFSAPVKLQIHRRREDLAFLMAYDSDAFNRWDAAQTLAQEILLNLAEHYQAGETLRLDAVFVKSFGEILHDDRLDGSIRAMMLDLPEERLLAQSQPIADYQALYFAREFVRCTIAEHFETDLRNLYYAQMMPTYYNDKASVAKRRLKKRALQYLTALSNPNVTALALHQFETAQNMTDAQMALECLVEIGGTASEKALQAFYNKWQHDPLVLDKWFVFQAQSKATETFEKVQSLVKHPDFNLRNPNRVRSLLATFGRNVVRFHDATGKTYQFLVDQVLALDEINPQIAARLASHFNNWRKLDEHRQTLIEKQLQRMYQQSHLSNDVREIVQHNLIKH